MKEIDMDKLNHCVSHDAEELEHISERAYIYHIVKQYFSRVPEIKSKKVPEIMVNYNNGEIIKTVLDFYENLDQGMYEQAKNILTGQSEIPIEIYDKEKARDESNEYPTNPLVRWRQKSIFLTDGNSSRRHKLPHQMARIFIPREGGIQDAYVLAHEISHTFDTDLNRRNNNKNNLLVEITPDCIENIMDYHLQRKGIITRDAILQRRIEKARGIRSDFLGTLARIELATLQREKGNLDEQLIKEYLKKAGYRVSDEELQWACEKVMRERRGIGYISRYIVADLVTSPYFQRIYEQDPQKAIRMLKNFNTKMKEGTPEESLKALGITLDMQTIDRLMDSKAGYIVGLDIQNGKSQNSDNLLR